MDGYIPVFSTSDSNDPYSVDPEKIIGKAKEIEGKPGVYELDLSNWEVLTKVDVKQFHVGVSGLFLGTPEEMRTYLKTGKFE